MKTILAFATALVISTSAYAQHDGTRHMFEFNADSILQGILSFEKSKTRGNATDNSTQLDLSLNYAYSIPSMPRLQVGGRINYVKGTEAGRGDLEDYGAEAGAIVNMWSDLRNSPYASLYLGLGWANTYGGTAGRKDEILSSTLAFGKRYSLERFGINSLTYTPEIAFENLNSTTGSNLEYAQSIQFRLLQFSAFF
jgi:hypothetical protein